MLARTPRRGTDGVIPAEIVREPLFLPKPAAFAKYGFLGFVLFEFVREAGEPTTDRTDTTDVGRQSPRKDSIHRYVGFGLLVVSVPSVKSVVRLLPRAAPIVA